MPGTRVARAARRRARGRSSSQRSCCGDCDGSRNASSQYRAYERSASRTSTIELVVGHVRADHDRRRFAASRWTPRPSLAGGPVGAGAEQSAPPPARAARGPLASRRRTPSRPSDPLRSRHLAHAGSGFRRRRLGRLHRVRDPILAVDGGHPLADRHDRQYGEHAQGDIEAVRDAERRRAGRRRRAGSAARPARRGRRSR